MGPTLGRWCKALGETLRASGLTLQKFLITLAAGVLCLQAAQLIYYASMAADSRAVIAGLDNDGSNAIDVAGRSQWFRDNGFAGYGPVYFRLANTAASILPPLTAPGELSAAEGRTKTLHFSLLLVSALSLVGLGFYLATLTTESLGFRCLFASILTVSFLQTESAREILLRAHPDYLLALMTALAVGLSVRFWKDPSDLHRFRISAWAWGLAMAIKLSLVVFMPFVILPVLFYRRSLKAAFIYVGHMLLAYFLLGFPQNLNLPRTFRFLRDQTLAIDPATWSSVKDWLELYAAQAWAPVLIFVLALYTFKKMRTLPKDQLIFSLALGLGPFLLMCLQKVLVPHGHYVLPVVASQLVLISQTAFGSRLLSLRTRIGVVALILGLFIWQSAQTMPLAPTLDRLLQCRPEARAVFAQLMKRQRSGHNIFVDPYVPSLDHTERVKSSWYASKPYVAENNFDVLVLKHSFDMGYLDEANTRYLLTYTKDLVPPRAFYSLFRETDHFEDAEIGDFRKTYSDACGWEIWERTDKGTP